MGFGRREVGIGGHNFGMERVTIIYMSGSEEGKSSSVLLFSRM